MSGGRAPASQPAAPGPRSVGSARARRHQPARPHFHGGDRDQNAGDLKRRWPQTVRGRGRLRAAARARL